MEWEVVRRGFRQHWLLLSLSIVIIVGATATGVALAKDHYESTSTLVVQPTSTEVSTQLLAYLIPSIEARITGPGLESEVRSGLTEELQGSEWTVSTAVEPGAGVMQITIDSEDPDVPVDVSNGYADAVSTLDLGTDALEVQVIDPATTAEKASERPILLATGIGLLILFPLLLAAALGFRDERRARDFSD